MAKRKYSKKSDYWKKFEGQQETSPAANQEEYAPDIVGDPFYVSSASYKSTSSASYSRKSNVGQQASRVNRSALSNTIDRFSSIRRGMLPYKYSEDGIDVREAIELCQKAYANVSVFRNAVQNRHHAATGMINDSLPLPHIVG